MKTIMNKNLVLLSFVAILAISVVAVSPTLADIGKASPLNRVAMIVNVGINNNNNDNDSSP